MASLDQEPQSHEKDVFGNKIDIQGKFVPTMVWVDFKNFYSVRSGVHFSPQCIWDIHNKILIVKSNLLNTRKYCT